MYSVKLDETKHFTGAYASVGSIEGGIQIESLPPDLNTSYKYDYHEITTTEQRVKTDEMGNPIYISEGVLEYEEVQVVNNVLEWFLDEELETQKSIEELETQRQEKIKELSEQCEKTITSGINVQTTYGSEHFSLQLSDQIEIDYQYGLVLTGESQVYYHADDTLARMFSAEEMTAIHLAKQEHVKFYRTYFNMLKQMVKDCKTKEQIAVITWGQSLTATLDAQFKVLVGKSTL